MTDRTVEGLVLTLGSALFLVGAANPVLARAWAAPRETFLRIVAGHPGAWRTTSVLFLAGSALTAGGMVGLPTVAGIDADGARAAAAVAGLVVAVAMTLWIVSLVGRLTVLTDSAATFVAGSGTATPVPSERLAGGLFGAFILLAGPGLVAMGAALVAADMFPLVGWACAAFGAIVTVGYLVFGDMPPFVVYLPTGLIGVALLLGWR